MNHTGTKMAGASGAQSSELTVDLAGQIVEHEGWNGGDGRHGRRVGGPQLRGGAHTAEHGQPDAVTVTVAVAVRRGELEGVSAGAVARSEEGGAGCAWRRRSPRAVERLAIALDCRGIDARVRHDHVLSLDGSRSDDGRDGRRWPGQRPPQAGETAGRAVSVGHCMRVRSPAGLAAAPARSRPVRHRQMCEGVAGHANLGVRAKPFARAVICIALLVAAIVVALERRHCARLRIRARQQGPTLAGRHISDLLVHRKVTVALQNGSSTRL
mmetsp:Transcript_28813/g.93708  ORF Transcript_28813/g.93708 Transcript_28813/m.93708 type:complete len:269 (+) Transcript_28813:533-1339(+)